MSSRRFDFPSMSSAAAPAAALRLAGFGLVALGLFIAPRSWADLAPAEVRAPAPALAAAPTPTAAAASATPTVAAVAAPPALSPAGPCRPGTADVILHSAKAQWHVSPCFGGVSSVRLLDAQFAMAERPGPAGLPAWARSKAAAGPLDLVDSWDAKWDPFRDFFDRLDVGSQPVTDSKTGALLTQRLKDLTLSDPVWGVLQQGDKSVVLAWPDPARVNSPLYLVKEYTVGPEGQPYSLGLEVSVYNLGTEQAQVTLVHDLSAYQAETQSGGLMAMFSSPPDLKSAAMHVGEETPRFDAHALASAELAERTRVGLPSWFGVDSRYFLLAAAPISGFAAQNDARLQAVGNGILIARMRLAPETLGAGTGGCVHRALASVTGRAACAGDAKIAHAKTWKWQLYTGPKDVDLLKPAGHDLYKAIDFGWFSAIALPMLAVLRWGHDFSGSWPVAILLLTVLVKALLWPVTMRSMKSMKKMSALKPEIDKAKAELEERAKKLGKPVDPQELNRVTFDMYKQHGVNPVGGCFPLLLQMPVYIALYRSINASVSLYNQPLFLWINDMTQKDPYYVLPLVLGVFMFLQQKITPQAAGGDPAQQKMMLYFMPILFTGMMLGLPSGLTLYILINTVLSLIQTLVMQRSDIPVGKTAA